VTRIEVSKLPIDPGPAAWNCLLEPAATGPELNEKLTADWLIIGAGFAGLSAARRLSQLCPSDRIVMLEARGLAEGPAGRNSGFMIDLPHDLASADYGGALDADVELTADNRHAIDFAAEAAKDYGLSAEAFARSGKINAAASGRGAAHNATHAKHLTAMGESFQTLDAQQMQDLTGTQYYQSGLYTPGTAIIQPAMYVRDFAKGLQSNRVQIFENSPVTSLERGANWVAETPKGRVTAPKVILAVNGHLNSFGFAKNRLLHVFTYASMTRALSTDEVTKLGGEPIWGVTPADPVGTTVRRISGQGGDRVVVRNCFTVDASMVVTPQRIDRVAKDHDRAFQARFPMLAGVEMEYRWGGRLCLSRNNVNVVSEVDTGLYAACCQNGLGTVRGTLTGILAAELATDTPSERLDRALRAAPPARLPPLTSVGANLMIKWQERQAGLEK